MYLPTYMEYLRRGTATATHARQQEGNRERRTSGVRGHARQGPGVVIFPVQYNVACYNL